MTDFIQLGNQLSAPRPLSFASKWPLTTPLKWFTTNWSPRRLVTLAPPAANTKNVAAIATAVPPHTIYCEGLIQTWVTEVESIWLYTDLYIFLNSYLRKISKSSWLFSLFFSLPALLPFWIGWLDQNWQSLAIQFNPPIPCFSRKWPKLWAHLNWLGLADWILKRGEYFTHRLFVVHTKTEKWSWSGWAWVCKSVKRVQFSTPLLSPLASSMPSSSSSPSSLS